MPHDVIMDGFNRLEMLLQGLATDLETVGVELEAGVYDLKRRRWVAGRFPEAPFGFGQEGYVLSLPGRQRLLAASRHEAADLLAEVADEVQEWAIDEIGRGWPELCDEDGAFVGLLQFALDGEQCVWAIHARAQAIIGKLSTLPIARPSA